MRLKSCPFCGNKVHIDKRPLWSGNHGYQGCYEYIIECKNEECGCSLQTKGIDTIYRDDKTACNNAERRGTGGFKVTNYERIKKMSIEEMQEFIIKAGLGDVDTARTYCSDCKGKMYDCDDCVRWWLELDSKEHPQSLDYWNK